MFKTLLRLFVLLLMAITLNKCAASSNKTPKRQLYTAHNIWIDNPEKIYGINYKSGKLIPCGTPVELLGYKAGRRPYFTFKFSQSGKQFRVYLVDRFQPGLTIGDLSQLMFTRKTFRELTQGLHPDEIRAIRDAKIVKGMSKKAVLIALGYPPRHQTASINLNSWKYWTDHWHTFTVNFDKNGLVTKDISWKLAQ